MSSTVTSHAPDTSDDTPAEAAVRAEVRPWMEEHAGRFGPGSGHLQLGDSDEYIAAARAWQAELDSGGWGAPSWAPELGGRGYDPSQVRVVKEEELRFAVPAGAFHVALSMVGPTIMQFGTPAQRGRFLGAMRRGEHLWCQLFSEPDAGSDLASLRTKAVRDGDEWIVDGQKVWTSGARYADWGILLARTDPDSNRHTGITYFLVDMRTPGIEVRPLVQINRGAHFNEVFLREVRIPAANVLGEVGEGWAVARATLGAERMMIGSISMSDRLQRIIDQARSSGRLESPVTRDRLVDAWIRSTLVTLTGDRVAHAMRHGGEIGPEASVLKLALSNLMEQLGSLAIEVLGADGMLEGVGPEGYGDLQDQFLGQWSSRIGGGTEQIQRNLIGERALGLSRDPGR
ncbi:acyl-CoA dehydrogenase family protein [Actinospongicola halichondriae]|uniref:acyl-CoA dehydrogenase family protein n=1 Tax=Actinospongicola halichondriae TaxID=3236844 RepID=UPI003D58CA44